MVDRESWERLANQAPSVPKTNTELAWIESRFEQLESALDDEFCEKISIVGSGQLIAKLENQYQEDVTFRRRWRHTQFIFLPAYWEFDGDDDHWYSMGVQTYSYDYFEAHGLAYATPVSKSFIEIYWTLFWNDGMSHKDAEAAALRLSE